MVDINPDQDQAFHEARTFLSSYDGVGAVSRELPAFRFQQPVKCEKRSQPMAIPTETLQAMIRSFNGFDLTDEELERVRPELDNYIQEMEKLRELNLADVMSSRLIRAQEGEAI
jgi:hypothetical protein